MTTTNDKMGTKRSLFLTALITSVVAFQLNATMLNPAVENMQQVLHADVAQIGRSTALFFLSTAIFGIFIPRLSDMKGRKKVTIAVMIALAVGTVVAMVAPNIYWLYLGRAIQGACGPVVPLTLLILRNEIDDPEEYGTLMGLIVAINGGIAGIDVIIGGWIADNWGFRWILVVTLVLEVLAIIFTYLWVPESRPTPQATMDWPGVILLAIGVVSITWMISGDIVSSGWPDRRTPVWLVVAVVSVGLFLWWEHRAKSALIPVDVMKTRATWALPLNTFMTLTAIFAAVNLVLPAFTQNPTAGWQMTSMKTALFFMAPYALIGWAVGPAAGHFAPRIGYLKTLRVGTLGAAISLVFFALCGFGNPWMMFIAALLLGVTYAGISNVILNGLGVVLAPPDQPGLLVGLNGAAFGIGAGFSNAILGQIITMGSPRGSVATTGYTTAIWVAAGLAVVALAMSFLLPKNAPGGDKL